MEYKMWGEMLNLSEIYESNKWNYVGKWYLLRNCHWVKQCSGSETFFGYCELIILIFESIYLKQQEPLL